MPFKKNICVCQYECDANNRMKISEILRHAQQISTDHCDKMGNTYEELHKYNAVFLLAKLSVEIFGDVAYTDELELTTSPTPPKRASFQRITTAECRGEKVFSIDARWILIDTQTRKILRDLPEGMLFDYDDREILDNDIRIKRGEAQFVAQVGATYSRTDVNMHMNNTEYADCVCDAIPADVMMNCRLQKITLHYHNELKFGETMDVSIAQIDELVYYVCGERDGVKFFEAQAAFVK